MNRLNLRGFVEGISGSGKQWHLGNEFQSRSEMQKATMWNGKPRNSSGAGFCRPLEFVVATVLVIITYSCTFLALILPKLIDDRSVLIVLT